MSNEVSISPDLIKEFLRVPRSDIRGRGEILYLKGHVLEAYYDSNTFKVIAQVQGTQIYDTAIKFSSSFEVIIDSECSCPHKETCKHIIALAYHILNHKKIPIVSIPKVSAFKLEKESSSTFRMIPGNAVKEWRTNIKYLKPQTPFPERPSNSFIYTILSNDLIKGEFFTKDWYSAPQEKNGEIEIRLKDNKLSTRCKTCSLKSVNLCKHQYIILDELLKTKNAFESNYDKLLTETAQKHGLSKDVTAKNFKLLFEKGNYYSVPLTDDIQLEEDLEQLQGLLSNNFDYEKLAQKLTVSIKKGEAFLWTEEVVRRKAELLLVVSGNSNKDGTKISTNLQVKSRPELLSPTQFQFYNSFQLLKKTLHDRFDDNDYLNFWNLVSDNRDLIKSSLNFVFKSKTNAQLYGEDDIYYARKSDLKPFVFSDDEVNVYAVVDKENEFYQIKFHLKIGTVEYNIGDKDIINAFSLIKNGEGYFYENPYVYKFINTLREGALKKFLPSDKGAFYEFIGYLEDKIEVINNLPTENNDVLIDNYRYVIDLKEFGEFIVFEPSIKFDQGDIKVLIESSKYIGGKRYSFEKDQVIDFRNLFLNFNDHFVHEVNYPCVYLHKDNYLNHLWYLDFFEKCNELGIKITGLNSFKNLRLSEHKAEIEEDLSSNIDWFDLNITMKFGDQVIERKQWIKAIKDGQQYIELKDGSLGLLPEEWFDRLSNIVKVADNSSEGLRINKMRFNIIDALFEEIDDEEIVLEIETKKRALLNFKERESYKLPELIRAQVRPYQQQGYDWLRFLEHYKLGGILADDMGLGKTLQMISLLANAKSENECFALIIVPNSLLFNWSRELEKFCPELSYLIYHSTDRKTNIKHFHDYDIIITTYGTATKDAQLLSGYTFSHIILDESQAIKNPSSKRFKAMRLLRGHYKFCLTGTPIENNTFDLYAQMSFVNPGLLGNQTYFKVNFSNPIDKAGDVEATKLLTKMVHPFLLRRTKDQVAQDLPDKTESVIYCEMYPKQRKMYDELKEQIRRDLMNKMNEDDGGLKFMVLDGLLRLRQLCNSPLLVDNNLGAEESRSAKIDALVYSLSEEIGDGNALVFSQFVQTLSLIKNALDLKGIKYAYLDGQTKKRDEVVDQFMNDSDCKVFLLSLKAGNTGLNLTKAQYVYIFDPWWNPAVEAQAIDRTHRIGQNNKVFAYKLICKDTIEEKIVQLQKRKKKIASDIIKTDDAVFKSLKKEDLLALFE